MVRLCLRISAERGNELVLDGQWLVREDGTRTALGPLARELSLLGSEQEWIDAINHRYNVLLAVTSRGATLVGGPTDDIIARAHLQLYRSAHLPEPREEVYQREIFPGIVEMLVEDHPESYEITRAEVIAACGLQPMLNAAAANLSTVKYAVRESQHGITLFGGPSPYLGVLARDLPWVARNWLDTEPGPGGALVAVPTRRHLAIHPVTTISGFATSIGGLAHIATQLYGTEMNPVSPDVYWWHEHEYHQVTRITDAGVVRSLSPRVVDVINTLPHS
jgi:hypothetical protein